jgi:signal transduction histidine kinase
VNVAEFLEEYARSGEGIARRRTFSLDISEEARAAHVLVDCTRFPLALKNLLDNAFKFEREPGRAEVVLRARREAGRVLVEVHDDGIGIGESLGEQVFERFTQANMSSTREHQGAGLGLAVVREIVAAHDGTVRLVAPVLGGTSVRISLPESAGNGKE